jgi:recombination associated protein RdgC
MANNPFKSFIPYTVKMGSLSIDDLDSAPEARDPSGGAWRTEHLTSPLKGEGLAVQIGISELMAVQFNERILPGKVRNEQLDKEVAKLEQSYGHKISKREYAQLRDQVEFDLLPRAFIRRTVVPVILTKGYMLICTSSQKRADDVCVVLQGVFGEAFKPWKIQTAMPVSQMLTTLARDSHIAGPDGDDLLLGYTDSATLKGSGKKTIRIKDKDLAEQDVSELLVHDYTVHELGMQFGLDEEPDLTFSLNDNLTFKRATLPDVKATPLKEDFHGFALLCAQTYRKALDEVLQACGGIAELQQMQDEVGKPAATDDDEL